MATPNAKLATSLAALQSIQHGERRVFRSSEITRVHRERLLQNGFLQEVMKGWIIYPSSRAGDSTPWYASFWEFCACFCQERFGEEWHLSPEQSLLLHSENTVIPTQTVVHSPRGTNNKIDLLFGTSLYDLRETQMPPAADLTIKDGLRLYSPAAALVRVPESFFVRNPVGIHVVLANIADPSDVLWHLLQGGHSVVAGRLAGAFRRGGRPELAEEIIATMKAAGHKVRETDPFAPSQTPAPPLASEPPIVTRMKTMWASMRERVLDVFPKPPGLPLDKTMYLRFVDDSYRSDAYHSLSIEGYAVSAELIDRVHAGNWRPDIRDADRHSRDALAARGYWQAFQVVTGNIAEIIGGASPGGLVRNSHRDWYRELFQPCVAAGLISPAALAGYRNHPVYLRTSRYVPVRWEALRDAMPAFFDLLESEKEPGVRAVLSHWLFGYIHPYPDGNGRIARFLMNALLASGGYPWTVIRVEDRVPYLTALDSASIDLDIGPFADFIAESVLRSSAHFSEWS